MLKFFFFLLFAAVPIVRADDRILVPAELIHQLFDTQDVNKRIAKRPFRLNELRSLLTDARFTAAARTRQDITRRYLAISYPAGTVSALDLFESGLPDDVVKALVEASPGSLRLTLPQNLAEGIRLLERLPYDLRETFLASPNAFDGAFDSLDLAELLQLGDDRFRRIVPSYSPSVTIRDYLFSTPSDKHFLARLLEASRWRATSVSTAIAQCETDECRSPSAGSSYATLRFQDKGTWSIAPGDLVDARCHYANVQRREFAGRLEIEYAFERCALVAVNGEPPVLSPLLRDLSEVQ